MTLRYYCSLLDNVHRASGNAHFGKKRVKFQKYILLQVQVIHNTLYVIYCRNVLLASITKQEIYTIYGNGYTNALSKVA